MEIALVVLPLALASIGYTITQSWILFLKNRADKEERYLQILKCINAFGNPQTDPKQAKVQKEDRNKMLEELKKCLLYAPDEVITAGNNFCISISVGTEYSQKERHKMLRDFLLSMRKDMFVSMINSMKKDMFISRKTNLESKDMNIFLDS